MLAFQKSETTRTSPFHESFKGEPFTVVGLQDFYRLTNFRLKNIKK